MRYPHGNGHKCICGSSFISYIRSSQVFHYRKESQLFFTSSDSARGCLHTCSPACSPGSYTRKPGGRIRYLTSVCTDSWRCPNLHEFDAVGCTTRILLFVCLNAEEEQVYYMVNHLEFSPITKPNHDNASRTAAIGSANASDYILTCQRQSPLYLVDESEDGTSYQWEASSRSGRAVGIISGYAGDPEHICAIDLHDLLERPMRESGLNKSGTDFKTGAQSEHDLTLLCKKIRRPRSIGDWTFLYKLNLDEYSGALWYFYGSSVYIRFFE